MFPWFKKKQDSSNLNVKSEITELIHDMLAQKNEEKQFLFLSTRIAPRILADMKMLTCISSQDNYRAFLQTILKFVNLRLHDQKGKITSNNNVSVLLSQLINPIHYDESAFSARHTLLQMIGNDSEFIRLLFGVVENCSRGVSLDEDESLFIHCLELLMLDDENSNLFQASRIEFLFQSLCTSCGGKSFSEDFLKILRKLCKAISQNSSYHEIIYEHGMPHLLTGLRVVTLNPPKELPQFAFGIISTLHAVSSCTQHVSGSCLLLNEFSGFKVMTQTFALLEALFASNLHLLHDALQAIWDMLDVESQCFHAMTKKHVDSPKLKRRESMKQFASSILNSFRKKPSETASENVEVVKKIKSRVFNIDAWECLFNLALKSKSTLVRAEAFRIVLLVLSDSKIFSRLQPDPILTRIVENFTTFDTLSQSNFIEFLSKIDSGERLCNLLLETVKHPNSSDDVVFSLLEHCAALSAKLNSEKRVKIIVEAACSHALIHLQRTPCNWTPLLNLCKHLFTTLPLGGNTPLVISCVFDWCFEQCAFPHAVEVIDLLCVTEHIHYIANRITSSLISHPRDWKRIGASLSLLISVCIKNPRVIPSFLSTDVVRGIMSVLNCVYEAPARPNYFTSLILCAWSHFVQSDPHLVKTFSSNAVELQQLRSELLSRFEQPDALQIIVDIVTLRRRGTAHSLHLVECYWKGEDISLRDVFDSHYECLLPEHPIIAIPNPCVPYIEAGAKLLNPVLMQNPAAQHFLSLCKSYSCEWQTFCAEMMAKKDDLSECALTVVLNSVHQNGSTLRAVSQKISSSPHLWTQLDRLYFPNSERLASCITLGATGRCHFQTEATQGPLTLTFNILFDYVVGVVDLTFFAIVLTNGKLPFEVVGGCFVAGGKNICMITPKRWYAIKFTFPVGGTPIVQVGSREDGSIAKQNIESIPAMDSRLSVVFSGSPGAATHLKNVWVQDGKTLTLRLRMYSSISVSDGSVWLRNMVKKDGSTSVLVARLQGLVFVPSGKHSNLADCLITFGITKALWERIQSAGCVDPESQALIHFLCVQSNDINKEPGFFKLIGSLENPTRVAWEKFVRVSGKEILPLPLFEYILTKPYEWTADLFHVIAKQLNAFTAQGLLNIGWMKSIVIGILNSTRTSRSLLFAATQLLSTCLRLTNFHIEMLSLHLNSILLTYEYSTSNYSSTQFRHLLLWNVLHATCDESSSNERLTTGLGQLLTLPWFAAAFSPNIDKVTVILTSHLLAYSWLNVPAFRAIADKNKFHVALESYLPSHDIGIEFVCIWVALLYKVSLSVKTPNKYLQMLQVFQQKPKIVHTCFMPFVLMMLAKAVTVKSSTSSRYHLSPDEAYKLFSHPKPFYRAAQHIVSHLRMEKEYHSKCTTILQLFCESPNLLQIWSKPENFYVFDTFIAYALSPPSRQLTILSLDSAEEASVSQQEIDDEFVLVEGDTSVSADLGRRSPSPEPMFVSPDGNSLPEDESVLKETVEFESSTKIRIIQSHEDIPTTELSTIVIGVLRRLAKDILNSDNKQQKLPYGTFEYAAGAIALHDLLHCYHPAFSKLNDWLAWYESQLCIIWIQELENSFFAEGISREKRIILVRNAVSVCEYVVDRCHTGHMIPVDLFLRSLLNVLHNLQSPSSSDVGKIVHHLRRFVLFVLSPTYHSNDPVQVTSVLESFMVVRSLLWHSISAEHEFLRSISYRLFGMFGTLEGNPKGLSLLLKVWCDILAFASQDVTLVEKAFSTTLLGGAGRRLDAYHGRIQILLDEESEQKKLDWVRTQKNPKGDDTVADFMNRAPKKICMYQHSTEVTRITKVFPAASISYREKYVKVHTQRVAKMQLAWRTFTLLEQVGFQYQIEALPRSFVMDSVVHVSSCVTDQDVRRLDSSRNSIIVSPSKTYFDDVVASEIKVRVPQGLWIFPVKEQPLQYSDNPTPLTANGRAVALEIIFPESQLLYIGNCYRVLGVDPMPGLVLITATRLIFISGGSVGESGDIHFREVLDEETVAPSGGLQAVMSTLASVFQRTKHKNLKRHAQIFHQSKASGPIPNVRMDIPLTLLSTITNRRYQHFPVGAELEFSFHYKLFLALTSPAFVMQESFRNSFVTAISNSSQHVQVITHKSTSEMKAITKSWCNGSLSNLEYLLQVNEFAGRTISDLGQYPVVPWIITDYSSPALHLDHQSSSPLPLRDLTKPIGALDPTRASEFVERYKAFAEAEQLNPANSRNPAFHYGSHYSSSAIVLFYQIRLQPYTAFSIQFQGGKIDVADRLFHSIAETWSNCSSRSTADVKEVIPEFYQHPYFLLNLNGVNLGTRADDTKMGDVVLPPWSHGNPYLFTMANRIAMEREYVSQNIPAWIDLIFGVHSRGEEAEQHLNTFHYLTYDTGFERAMSQAKSDEERNAIVLQIDNFGQTPKKIFSELHVARSKLSDFSSTLRQLGENLVQQTLPNTLFYNFITGDVCDLQFLPCNAWCPRTKVACPFQPPGTTSPWYYLYCDVALCLRAVQCGLEVKASIHQSFTIPLELTPCGGDVRCFVSSPDGCFVVFGMSTGLLYVYVSQRLGAVPTHQNTLTGHNDEITHVYLCPRSFVLLSVARDNELCVWRVNYSTSAFICRISLPYAVSSLTYDNKDGFIYVAGEKTMNIFSTQGHCLFEYLLVDRVPITSITPCVLPPHHSKKCIAVGFANSTIEMFFLQCRHVDFEPPVLSSESQSEAEKYLLFDVMLSAKIASAEGANSVTFITCTKDPFSIITIRSDLTAKKCVIKEK